MSLAEQSLGAGMPPGLTPKDTDESDEADDTEESHVSGRPRKESSRETSDASDAQVLGWMAGMSTATAFVVPIPESGQTQSSASALVAADAPSALSAEGRTGLASGGVRISEKNMPEGAVAESAKAGFTKEEALIAERAQPPASGQPGKKEERADLTSAKDKAGLASQESSVKGAINSSPEKPESGAAGPVGDAPSRSVNDPEPDKTAIEAAAKAAVQAAIFEDPVAQAEKFSPAVQDGMSDASRDGTMQAARDLNEDSGLTEQKLPVEAVVGSASRVAGRTRKAETAGTDDATAGSADGSVSSVGARVAGNGDWEKAETGGSEGESRHATLDAVHRALDHATQGLEQTGASSLMVVVNPDTETQLALHVKWDQDHFEATAVVERGDFSALGAEWTHLQKRLADQGVSLAPLVSAGEFSRAGGGGESLSRRKSSEERESPEKGGPAKAPSSVASQRRPGARPVSAIQGREWWA
jgi:hypothetical protein